MAVHWEPWEDIATDTDADRSRTAVEAQTGYCSATLDVLWEDAQHYFMQVPTGKRRRRFRRRRKMKWRAQHYFFAVLKYIHMYPPEDNIVDIVRTKKIKITRKGFYSDVMPLARLWSMNVNHIKWGDRLAFDNHHPMFPYSHTAIWDSTCFRVQRAREWRYSRFVVNGHYDFP